MEINYLAVLVCSVFAMILGALWYGPLFGKKWTEIVGADPDDLAAREAMKKTAGPLYLVQFLLTLFQVYVLAHFIGRWNEASGIETSLWIYAAFIVPMVAASAMWNNDPKNVAWARFLIQAGYQLILFVLFGWVLDIWR